jgi:uncharacterized protein YdaU (DUF1376 family)
MKLVRTRREVPASNQHRLRVALTRQPQRQVWGRHQFAVVRINTSCLFMQTIFAVVYWMHRLRDIWQTPTDPRCNGGGVSKAPRPPYLERKTMPSKPDIWMPLYIGDYLAATSHLGALESGAYLHLLMHQWKNGSLPSDSESLRRIARVDKDAWSIAWSIIESFFSFETGKPVQLKMERIRAEWQTKKDNAVEKAKSAAKKRWDAPSNAQAMLSSCPSSSSSPSTNTSIREYFPKEAFINGNEKLRRN